MTILPIVYLPDPVLRRKAHKVENFDDDLKKLVSDMVETMREAPGVGLAAPQVGVSKRLAVIEYGDEDESKPKKLYVVINPEISFPSDDTVPGFEGCLSVPGYAGEVERFTHAVIKYQNLQGKPVKTKAKDWLARIFQHELDHLDGIVYIDRAVRIWKPSKEEEIELDAKT